jgi:hypothetical protein
MRGRQCRYPLNYADGLVRVGVQSSIAHHETALVLRR